MKAIKIDVVKSEVYEIDIQDSLKGMYGALECDCVTHIKLKDGEFLWLDDNGLLHDEPLGAFALTGYPQALSGNGLILGISAGGANRDTSLTVEEIKERVTFVNPARLPEPTIHVSRLILPEDDDNWSLQEEEDETDEDEWEDFDESDYY